MTDQQSFIEASVEVPRNISDAVSNFIVDNISPGILLEDSAYEQFIIIKFYVLSDDDNSFRQKLGYYFNSLLELDDTFEEIPDIKERTIENVEWEEAYKDSVKSVIIAGDVVVRPPWDEKPPEAVYDIVIEPKMAFGTGSHETTRSCLQVIRQTFKKKMTFLDIGCGSGILSILADQMGAKFIKAVDYDLISVENTSENFDLNEVLAENEIHHGSIECCQKDQPYDFVCANIIKVAILSMLDKLIDLTKPGGILVLSGLLDDDVDEISKHLRLLGLTEFSILEDNEWRTFTIHKKKS